MYSAYGVYVAMSETYTCEVEGCDELIVEEAHPGPCFDHWKEQEDE